MNYKENAIILLTEIIHSNKKLTKKQREELTILREQIKRSRSKKGFLRGLYKIGKFLGLNVDSFFDDSD